MDGRTAEKHLADFSLAIKHHSPRDTKQGRPGISHDWRPEIGVGDPL